MRKEFVLILIKKIIILRLVYSHKIDMELLNCSKIKLWNTIYDQINNIINAKTDKTFIVLCKNFDSVHNELLNVFYSYMQENEYTKLNYILLCENVAFIESNILDRCSIISVQSPQTIVIKKNLKTIMFILI